MRGFVAWFALVSVAAADPTAPAPPGLRPGMWVVDMPEVELRTLFAVSAHTFGVQYSGLSGDGPRMALFMPKSPDSNYLTQHAGLRAAGVAITCDDASEVVCTVDVTACPGGARAPKWVVDLYHQAERNQVPLMVVVCATERVVAVGPLPLATDGPIDVAALDRTDGVTATDVGGMTVVTLR